MGSELTPRRLAPDRCPARVYLAGLAPTGRRTQARALTIAAGILAPGVAPEDLPWERVRFQHAAAVRARLIEVGYAAATGNRVLGALRRVSRAAWALGLVPLEEHLRMADVPPIDQRRVPRGRLVAPAEVQRLLEVAPTVVKAAVALMYGCGLRVAEACTVTVEDLAGDTLKIRGKGGHERLVPVSAWVRRVTDAWRRLRGAHPGPLLALAPSMTPVPNTVASWVSRWAARAGLDHLTPHDLRRSFVSRLLGDGADLALVQRVAGHANPRTTAAYDRRPLEDARAALERLAPG